MDWDSARFLMIEQQIRTWEVLDLTLLERLFIVKREEFVPIDKRELAFADMRLPLGVADSFMLEPKMEARIVQEVAVSSKDKVLLVGAGSGYLAALVGSFAHHVHALEIQPELVTFAQQNVQRAAMNNVQVELGDGSRGLEKYAPYDIIILTGSLPILPEELPNQLAQNGRLFVVLGEKPNMQATLMTRTNHAFQSKHVFETCLPQLVNALQPARFTF